MAAATPDQRARQRSEHRALGDRPESPDGLYLRLLLRLARRLHCVGSKSELQGAEDSRRSSNSAVSEGSIETPALLSVGSSGNLSEALAVGPLRPGRCLQSSRGGSVLSQVAVAIGCQGSVPSSLVLIFTTMSEPQSDLVNASDRILRSEHATLTTRRGALERRLELHRGIVHELGWSSRCCSD